MQRLTRSAICFFCDCCVLALQSCINTMCVGDVGPMWPRVRTRLGVYPLSASFHMACAVRVQWNWVAHWLQYICQQGTICHNTENALFRPESLRVMNEELPRSGVAAYIFMFCAFSRELCSKAPCSVWFGGVRQSQDPFAVLG